MLRWVGLIMVVLGCGLMGQLLAKSLERRCKVLQELGQGLLILEREIGYSATLLPQALAQAGQGAGQAGELFIVTGELLAAGEGQGAGHAWLDALDRTAPDLNLEEETRQLLVAFGQGLGLSHSQDQLKRLELCRLRLEGLETEAKNKWRQLGKVWKNLGWAMGLALALLFF